MRQRLKNQLKDYPLKGLFRLTAMLLRFLLTACFTILLMRHASANPSLDWSETMPTAIDESPADLPQANHPQEIQHNDIDIKAFSDSWNMTKEIDPNINIMDKPIFETASPKTMAKTMDNRTEPISRPFYRQITLTDYNQYDCCARVFKATAWEVEDRCSEIGYQPWRIKHIPFTPATKPVQKLKKCYILEKKAVGINWVYQCTAKAEAHCFDPKLPQNKYFMKNYLESEKMKNDLIQETILLNTIEEHELTFDSLLRMIPERPKKTIPDDLTIPIVRPTVSKE